MRAVVQRVARASIRVRTADADEVVGEMGPGLLALVAIGQSDGRDEGSALVQKLTRMRVFPDDDGRLNRSLLEVQGALGLVSQFTLFGDLRKGLRPSFGESAPSASAAPLFAGLIEDARATGVSVVTGRFGADMHIELVNDGPVTLLLDTDRNF